MSTDSAEQIQLDVAAIRTEMRGNREIITNLADAHLEHATKLARLEGHVDAKLESLQTDVAWIRKALMGRAPKLIKTETHEEETGIVARINRADSKAIGKFLVAVALAGGLGSMFPQCAHQVRTEVRQEP